MSVKKTVQTLLRGGFILVFNQDKLDVVKTAGALQEAGIGNMEVTCRISRPLEKIAALRAARPDFAIGAAGLVDSPAMLTRYNAAHPDDPLPTVEEAVAAGELRKIKELIDGYRLMACPKVVFSSATVAQVERCTGRLFNVTG